MVGIRLTPLPTELFSVEYQDIVERVEKRAQSDVRKAVAQMRSDLLADDSIKTIIEGLYSGDLKPVNLYRGMSDSLRDVKINYESLSDRLEKAGRSVVRIASRDVARRVDAYIDNRPDFVATRRDVRFDESDQNLDEEVLRGSRLFWHIYQQDTLRAIKDEIEDSYLSGDSPDVMARKIESVVGLSPRQADALRRMRKTLATGPLPPDARERQVAAYSEKLIDDRARMVTRTELNRVANSSVVAYWSQMMARGSLDRNSVVLRWNTRYDERTCLTCGPLDGTQTALHTWFAPGVPMPPAHPNCRCSLTVASIDTGMSSSDVKYEFVTIEKSVKSSVKSVAAAGGERIAQAMTPEERSERTRRGWLKRRRALRTSLRPKRGKKDRAASGISVRTQTDAARRKSGIDYLPSSDLSQWTEEEQTHMLGKLKQFSPDFDRYKDKDVETAQDAVEILKDNIRTLVEEMGGIDSEKAQTARQWYSAAGSLCEDLGGSIAKNHPDAVGAAVVAVLSPKNDWNNNVGQAAVLFDFWKNDPVMEGEIIDATHALMINDLEKTIKRASKDLPKALEELEVWKKTGYSSSGKTKQSANKIAAREKELAENAEKLSNNQKLLAYLKDVDVEGFRKEFEGTNFRSLPEDLQQSFYRGYINAYEIRAPEVAPTKEGNYTIENSERAKLTSPMPAFAIKALNILRMSEKLDNGDIDDDEFQFFLNENMGGGSKVRSFYMNLYDPFDDEQRAVTVDTHMGSAALLLPLGASMPPISDAIFSQWAGGGAGQAYMIHAEAVRQLADELGVLPRELQSMVWEHQLERYGPGFMGSAKSNYAKKYAELSVQVVDRLGYEVFRKEVDSVLPKLFKELTIQEKSDKPDSAKIKELNSQLDAAEKRIRDLLVGTEPKSEEKKTYLKEKKSQDTENDES